MCCKLYCRIVHGLVPWCAVLYLYWTGLDCDVLMLHRLLQHAIYPPNAHMFSCSLLSQAAVIVLNKRGWVGYLVPHETERKFYCHFHYQQRMDSGKRVSAFEHEDEMVEANQLKPPHGFTVVWGMLYTRLFVLLHVLYWGCILCAQLNSKIVVTPLAPSLGTFLNSCPPACAPTTRQDGETGSYRGRALVGTRSRQ